MAFMCDCGLEAKLVEHHDNYRRTYACCPKRVRILFLFHVRASLYHARTTCRIDDTLISGNMRRMTLHVRTSMKWTLHTRRRLWMSSMSW